MDFIADQLHTMGLGAKRIGIETDSYYFSARARDRLTSRLPDAMFQDASMLVNWARIVKSPQEIEYMRQAGVIAGLAMQAAFETIKVGVRQCDAAAAITSAQIFGTSDFGGDVPPGLVMGPGDKARAPHLRWSDAPFNSSESVTIELGACRRRYHAGLARTIFTGRPPAALRDLAATIDEGMETAVSVVRPGVTCETIEAAWRHVIYTAGYEKRSRIGYSIGLGYPPSWIEQTASLRPGDTTILEPNMTFHIILGMWQEPVSYVVSETIRVTDNGCETLTNLPRGLHLNA